MKNKKNKIESLLIILLTLVVIGFIGFTVLREESKSPEGEVVEDPIKEEDCKLEDEENDEGEELDEMREKADEIYNEYDFQGK